MWYGTEAKQPQYSQQAGKIAERYITPVMQKGNTVTRHITALV
jgi:hypothetical protein